MFPESRSEVPGAEPDPLNGAKSFRELYEIASTNYTGKYTVPDFIFPLIDWFFLGLYDLIYSEYVFLVI